MTEQGVALTAVLRDVAHYLENEAAILRMWVDNTADQPFTSEELGLILGSCTGIEDRAGRLRAAVEAANG